MQVKSILKAKSRKKIVSLEPGSSVEDAIQLMHKKKISAIMVMEKNKPVGIFTERDVVRSYTKKKGRKFRQIPLKEVMTKKLIVARQDDNLGDIMAIMVEKNIRHLPVLEDGQIVNMLSIRDVIGF
ncbi:MAG TPA: CBS domain-containing protein [Thermodesulfovibrionales bacterium]|nr:CBS domain-containing protein [Thermodesulfovibrionales bacterium]